MKRIALFFFVLPGLSGCVFGTGAAGGRDREEIILCGDREVFILDLRSGVKRVWSWRAADRPEVPVSLRGRFNTTDECKPVDGGSRILITSSGGGVALVERAGGRAVFWAEVENAHSAERLPRNRILVAGSFGKAGNRLVLFEADRPERELASYPLQGAHGVVWEVETGRVWALGERELQAFELRDWETATPGLLCVRSLKLPDPGGHDLRPLPGTRRLLVTTDRRVWTFDRDREEFDLHRVLGDEEGVKSVDVHPGTGRTAYVKAETSWWSSRVRLLDPAGEIHLPGERLYKARWNP